MRGAVFVVKIGSSSLTTPDGELAVTTMRAVAAQIATTVCTLRSRVILVTSGAVAAGRVLISPEDVPSMRANVQRASRAAVGQIRLMDAYAEAFGEFGLATAQLLLTGPELNAKDSYESIRDTLFTLMALDDPVVVPVVNANDVVNNQLKENDDLAARLAVMCRARRLILLTDTEGLHDADPRTTPDAKLVPRAHGHPEALMRYVGPNAGLLGSGGMRSKVLAALTATNGGVETVIAAARAVDVVVKAASGQPVGTVVAPQRRPLPDKDVFIGAVVRPEGRLLLHRRMIHTLYKRSPSLLTVGIARVKGQAAGTSPDFSAGAVVSICGPGWREFGRALVSASALTIRLVAGLSAQGVRSLVELGEEQIDEARAALRTAAVQDWEAVEGLLRHEGAELLGRAASGDMMSVLRRRLSTDEFGAIVLDEAVLLVLRLDAGVRASAPLRRILVFLQLPDEQRHLVRSEAAALLRAGKSSGAGSAWGLLPLARRDRIVLFGLTQQELEDWIGPEER